MYVIKNGAGERRGEVRGLKRDGRAHLLPPYTILSLRCFQIRTVWRYVANAFLPQCDLVLEAKSGKRHYNSHAVGCRRS